jgi:hypothetical protein
MRAGYTRASAVRDEEAAGSNPAAGQKAQLQPTSGDLVSGWPCRQFGTKNSGGRSVRSCLPLSPVRRRLVPYWMNGAHRDLQEEPILYQASLSAAKYSVV